MWQALLEGGLYVNMARPPATPAGTYLLRCSLCAEHSAEQIETIIAMFRAAGKATGALDLSVAARSPDPPPHSGYAAQAGLGKCPR